MLLYLPCIYIYNLYFAILFFKGLDSVEKLLLDKHLEKGIINCTGDSHTWYTGQSDFIYLPKSEASNFIKIIAKFSASELFLEVAIPTYVKCFANTEFTFFSLCTSFASKSKTIKNYVKNCNGIDAVHPIKLSKPYGKEYMKYKMFAYEN